MSTPAAERRRYLEHDVDECHPHPESKPDDSHYVRGDKQAIDIIEDFIEFTGATGTDAYWIGSILKYLIRLYRKSTPLENATKAGFYLNRLIESHEHRELGEN